MSHLSRPSGGLLLADYGRKRRVEKLRFGAKPGVQISWRVPENVERITCRRWRGRELSGHPPGRPCRARRGTTGVCSDSQNGREAHRHERRHEGSWRGIGPEVVKRDPILTDQDDRKGRRFMSRSALLGGVSGEVVMRAGRLLVTSLTGRILMTGSGPAVFRAGFAGLRMAGLNGAHGQALRVETHEHRQRGDHQSGCPSHSAQRLTRNTDRQAAPGRLRRGECPAAAAGEAGIGAVASHAR